MAGLVSAQMRAMSGEQLGAIDAGVIARIGTGALAGLSSAQVGSLLVDQVGALSSVQVGGLVTGQLRGMMAEQVGALSLGAVRVLSSVQIGSLLSDQVGGFGSANADISNDKEGEKPSRRKPKVSCATLIDAGLVGT